MAKKRKKRKLDLSSPKEVGSSAAGKRRSILQ